MEIPNSYRSILGYIYRDSGDVKISNLSSISHLDEISFTTLDIDLESSSYDIPIFAKDIFEYNYREFAKIKGGSPFYNLPSKLIVPIYVVYKDHSKSPDTLIKRFFGGSFGTLGLCKVSGYGETHYIGKGVILDESFNILFLATIEAEKDKESLYFNSVSSKIYINPKVFIQDSLSMNKAIIKKLIPYYLEFPVKLKGAMFGVSTISPQIIIEEKPSIFQKQATFHPEKCNNENLNNILKNSINLV